MIYYLMINIFDINKPVQNSIIVYIIFIVLYIVFFQKFFHNQIKDKQYLLPVIVITLSIVVYYVFRMLQFYLQ